MKSNQPLTSGAPQALGHTLIRASAGTGKTYQLANRFLGLLHHDVPVDTILATTFTRKAAGEILDRVLLRFARAALDGEQAAELSAALELPGLSQERCLELIARAARHVHRLRIGTLDSFFAQLARSFGLELGLPPGWEIAQESHDSQLRREAVAAVLHEEETRDLKTLVNNLTKGESSRGVAELVRTTVDALHNLYLETRREAWHSLQRSAGLSPEELASVLADLSAASLAQKTMQTARDKDVEHAAGGDWETFVGKGLAAKVLDGTPTYYKAQIPPAVVALYQRLLTHARAELVGKVVLQTESTFQLLEKFDGHYQRRKREERVLRFEDVTRSLEGVQMMSDVGRLAFRLDAHVDQLLLDEFQDTSPPQWRVVRGFAQRITGEAPRGRQRCSFLCVGDVKQAIYGWRGGVAEIFDCVGRELPGLAPRLLTRSFRSAQPIIDAVNEVFTNLGKHPRLDREAAGVALWSERFQPHTTEHEGLSGYVCLETGPVVSEGDSKKEVHLGYAAERVAQVVQEAPNRSVGVLVRTNDAVARMVFELRERGVAASEEGGNPLTDSAAVLAILALLRLADHPGDRIARFHVENTPLAGLYSSGRSLDSLAVSQAVRRELLDRGYGPAVKRWAEPLVPLCTQRELSRLVQLVELAYGYDAQSTLRTADFVALVNRQRVPDPTAAKVRVMTIHQAKGLEFEIVVLPQLDARLIGQSDSFVVHRPDPAAPVERVCRYVSKDLRKLLPDDVQKMFDEADNRDVTESLCLLYVALTRAERALYMIIPASAHNEKTLAVSFAGMLRATLHTGGPALEKTRLKEYGDAKWFKQDPEEKPEASLAVSPEPPAPLVVQLAPAAPRRTRGFERVSPSSMEGGTRIKLSAVLADQVNAGALDRGTLIHAFFEEINWLDDGRPTAEALTSVAQRVLDPSMATRVNASLVIPQFQAMLDAPAIARAISRAAYATPGELGFPADVVRDLAGKPARLVVEKERRFALRYEGNKLLQGSIDRLVLLYSGVLLVAADILDYKTDAIAPGDATTLAERVDHYRPQLAAYRAAVSEMFALEPQWITARLLFVGSGQVVRV